MLILLNTYIEMLALRKGPDVIPRSWAIMALACGMLVLSSLCAAVMVEGARDQNYVLTYVGYLLGLFFYASIIVMYGYSARMLQTISAIVACGAIITFLYVIEYLVFSQLFGEQFASLVGVLIIFWSVPVEGHIMARAIQQHWLVGITIAMAALILQIGFQSAFAGNS